MAVRASTLRLANQVRSDLSGITDQQIRDLVSAWADAWNEVEPDLSSTLLDLLVAGDQISRSQMLRSERLKKVLTVIAQNLDELAAAAGTRITADLQAVIDVAGAAQASIIDSQLPPGAAQLVDLDTWSRVDPRQVAAIVRRSTKQITSRTKPLSRDAYAAVRGELVRGVAAGANPRVTAARIVARAHGGFNGGLARALTIARTETLDAHREAAALAQAEHSDVLTGWIWSANLRPRTCPACLSMNGTVHPLSEPGPLGHQNCRCARIPQLKPWSELGFDITEPPDAFPDADKYFESLTKDQQVTILGRRGWEAWSRGQFPRQAWATRVETKGWRDSYQSAKAPEPVSKGGAIIVPRLDDVPGEWTGKNAPTPGTVTRARGVTVDKSERTTSYRLASTGLDVHWLPNPSDRKTADATVGKITREIKAPQGETERTIRNNLANAHRQSKHVVLDLYRTPLRGDMRKVLDAIDAYWEERRRSGGRRVESILVLPENARDHFTLEYETWLSQR